MAEREELDLAFRRQLVSTLRGGHAFEPLEKIFSDVPPDRRFVVPAGMERSAWQIVDHMRRTLEDLIAYSSNFDGSYRELDWPADYWPAEAAPASGEEWERSVAGFFAALARVEALVEDPGRDLVAPFAWEPKHTLLREIMLAIEHNSYHAGELVELQRAL